MINCDITLYSRIAYSFLTFAAIFGCAGVLLVTGQHTGPANGSFGMLVGVALAWRAASLLIYDWRRQARYQAANVSLDGYGTL